MNLIEIRFQKDWFYTHRCYIRKEEKSMYKMIITRGYYICKADLKSLGIIGNVAYDYYAYYSVAQLDRATAS